MYYKAQGVDEDKAETVKWLLIASHKGHTDAQYTLATMYGDGEGTEQDFEESYYWFARAHESGLEKAAAARDEAAEKITPQQKEAIDEKLAEQLKNKRIIELLFSGL
jgi:TPR repeat protein